MALAREVGGLRETRRRLGEILVAEGVLTEAGISRAVGFQRMSGDKVKLGSILLTWELVDEPALLAALSKYHRTPAVSWPEIAAAKMEAVYLLPAAAAHRLGAIVYSAEKGTARVAFVNPSDIAAVDEVSAIAGRRVIAGVTSELRIMQAHQRFYGGHIPLEYRALIQKLQRKTTSTTNAAPPPAGLDFHAGDLVEAERDSRAWPAPASVPVPVEPGQRETPVSLRRVAREPIDIEVPEMPAIERQPTAAASRSEATPQPTAAPPQPQGTEEKRAAAEIGAPGPEPPPGTGEESLADWVGEALMSFQGDSHGGSARVRAQEHDPGTERPASDPNARGLAASPKIESPIAEAEDDPVAGMWQPAPPDDAENVASGMWTSKDNEPEAAIFEARSREEIADTVLANALIDIPRVVLLGVGRTFVTGWRGRGPGLTPERVAGIRVPIAGRSIFASVRDSKTPHFGAVEPVEWTSALRAVLGDSEPECAVFPIRVGDDIAAFLYADRLGQPMQYEDFARVARTAASAAGVLARFLLRHNAPVA